ncbi:MAG TPA: hypothetical protein PKX00_08855 [Opitutaceae bacterium]|jgi:hypothetical protein|nr:hypothetical protein [Opitutaceae bacterium]
MNTPSISKFAAASLGLLFSALLTTTAVAGPGPEYWARMNKNQKPASYPTIWRTKADADTKAQAAAKPAAEAAAGCTACQGCAKKS